MLGSRKFTAGLLSAMMLFSSSMTPVFAEDTADDTGSEAVSELQEKIDALPGSLLGSENIAEDYADLLAIKAEYEALSEEEQAEIDFTKAETLLDYNSDTLNPENLEKGNSLEGKVIGYLGSSITQGFRSDGVAFPEYIAQLSGSTSIKQAIPGGTLALKEGYREEVCYINQLLDGELTDVEHLDALVVQLSTNDVGAGIPIGELSESFASEDQDYETIIGAMEYITAYAKEKWDCPVMFYINAYLSDEACEELAAGDEEMLKVVKEMYQDNYVAMIDALYEVAEKWDLGVTDLWNNDYVKSATMDLRHFFMDDIIHPHKSGYYFWYTQPIMEELQKIIAENETVEHVFTYDAAAAGKTSDYSSVSAPKFIIYPGVLTDGTAEELMDEIGAKAIADKYAGSVTVVTPADGKAYGEADQAEFIELLGFAPSTIKVIGIDEGATFVNNYVSQACWAVSGIMTFGGEMKEGLNYDVPVPVYLSNASDIAKAYYERVNAGEELAYVETGSEATAAEAFANAWNKVFRKVYRQHNEITEFYNIPASAVTDPYPLIPSVLEMEEQYGVNYYTHYYEPLNGSGEYCWFEYIPQATLEMEAGTVPLIVTLHGNGNDARIQGETTGWVELAAEENFMVVSPEWQSVALVEGTSDTKPNFFDCDGLEREKLIEWIEMLKEKYPQIDESRIYVTGLSAGASASTLYGALYNDFFAGVAAVSGPGVDKTELAEVAETYDGNEMPWMYLCGDHDFFGMIPVDGSSPYSFEVAPGVHIQDVDPASSMFSFIQSYQKINGLEVSENYDMTLNEFYGIALEDQQWIKLGFKDALEGSLSNDKGEMIRLVAIKDQAHWNYKPEAAYIWDFFKNYSRDTETGELIVDEEPIVTEVDKIGNGNVYKYTSKRTVTAESENFYPEAYIVYADEQMTLAKASALLKKLGMVENMDKYGWNAIVAGPLGEEYGEADADLYPSLLDASGSMSSVKVIGVGKGADFVNEYVTEKAWAVSGFMTVDASKEADYGDIPAYVTSTEKETLSEAFANGWTEAFTKAMKIGNIGGTFYTMPLSKERPFEWAPWTESSVLGFERSVVWDDLDGDGKDSLWYEYVPATASKEEGSAPMVLMLHGNGNDPRTQFETSGWAQLAAKEGIILIEPEWQGTSFDADPMTENDSTTKENDIITMLEKVFAKYPQIDRSRVYVEGLSRGSLNTMDLVLTHPEIFACGGSHSGAVIGDLMSADDFTDIIAEEKDQYDMPWFFIAGTEDGFVPVSEKGAENSGVLQALNLFEELNEMGHTEYADLDESKVEWFGFTQMEDFGEVANTGSLTVKGGTIAKNDVPMLSFNAVENWGHWNYAPAAQLMWDFFKNYARDTKTGELIYVDENNIIRLSGSGRFQTSMKIAEAYKEEKGIEEFDNVIVTSGLNFADALAGSYLSYKKNAPILITADVFGDSKPYEEINAYIKDNLKEGGTVYVLGGTGAVSDTALTGLEGIKVERVKGASRFETNIEILKAAGVKDEEIVVATAFNFADSLSASAVNRPILLVDAALSDAQKEYLDTLESKKFYIVGGTGAVKETVETELKEYGEVKRLSGKSRHETSVEIAKKFCNEADKAVLAYSLNFPDGLCAGPLASAMKAPLILTTTGEEEAAERFCSDRRITKGYVIGGKSLIDDNTARRIFSAGSDATIIVK